MYYSSSLQYTSALVYSSIHSGACIFIPPLGVVLGSARMDFQKWFHKGVAPALSVCVALLFNTLRRLYIHSSTVQLFEDIRQDTENAVAARRAHGPPRRARARGSRRGHIVACSRARARQQIKISQNSGTPVPKRRKNGWTDCRYS